MRRLVGGAVLVAVIGAIAALPTGAATYRGMSVSGYTFDPNKHILTVQAKPYGWKMYPKFVGKKPNKADGGHWVIFVNGKRKASSTTHAVTVTKLPATGKIRFFVRIANNDHSPVKGAVKPEVFTVN